MQTINGQSMANRQPLPLCERRILVRCRILVCSPRAVSLFAAASLCARPEPGPCSLLAQAASTCPVLAEHHANEPSSRARPAITRAIFDFGRVLGSPVGSRSRPYTRPGCKPHITRVNLGRSPIDNLDMYETGIGVRV